MVIGSLRYHNPTSNDDGKALRGLVQRKAFNRSISRWAQVHLEALDVVL